MSLNQRAKGSVARVEAKLAGVEAKLAGVPDDFNRFTSSGTSVPLQKGQLNNIRLRPKIINEHAESSRALISQVRADNIVGQIFKASHDNINSIDVSLGSASISIFDNFEEYADDAALQAAWDYTGTALREAELSKEITAPDASTQSMRLYCYFNEGDEWSRTVPATDYSGYTGTMFYRATHDFSDLKVKFYISDGTNSKSLFLTQAAANQWEILQATFEQFTEDGAGITDTTAITKIGFRCDTDQRDGYVYIDTLISSPPSGSVKLKLFDLGTERPVSGEFSLADGTQYETLGDLGISGEQVSEITLNLNSGRRTYHVDQFIAGTAKEIPANVLLNVDHYYALTLNYIDTEINVYGPVKEWGDYYNSGYSFTVADEVSTVPVTDENESIMFIIYSTQDVYLGGFVNYFDATPGPGSSATLYLEDSTMTRTDVLIAGIRPPPSTNREIRIPAFLDKGGKIELEHNDDFADGVTETTFIMIYFFKKERENG